MLSRCQCGRQQPENRRWRSAGRRAAWRRAAAAAVRTARAEVRLATAYSAELSLILHSNPLLFLSGAQGSESLEQVCLRLLRRDRSAASRLPVRGHWHLHSARGQSAHRRAHVRCAGHRHIGVGEPVQKERWSRLRWGSVQPRGHRQRPVRCGAGFRRVRGSGGRQWQTPRYSSISTRLYVQRTATNACTDPASYIAALRDRRARHRVLSPALPDSRASDR